LTSGGGVGPGVGPGVGVGVGPGVGVGVGGVHSISLILKNKFMLIIQNYKLGFTNIIIYTFIYNQI